MTRAARLHRERASRAHASNGALWVLLWHNVFCLTGFLFILLGAARRARAQGMCRDESPVSLALAGVACH
jgi:hypothetical protein